MIHHPPAFENISDRQAGPNGPWGHVVLDDVSWETYDRLVRDMGSRTVPRLTFDQGRLYIVSPLPLHERYLRQLARFIECIAERAGLPCADFGSMTIRKEELQRGVEPDSCFYLQSWPAVQGKSELDFDAVPPPDLATEIDIFHASPEKMRVYAALGVPEIWRFDGERLRFFRLATADAYVEIATSLAFATLEPADVEPFLAQSFDVEPGELLRRFAAALAAKT